MEKTYEADDSVLSRLTLSDPTKVKVVVGDKSVHLYVGPRDWEWDRITGRRVGSGARMTELKIVGG